MPDNQFPNNILLAGHWHSDVHEEPMRHALQQLGCTVHAFKWHNYFDNTGTSSSKFSLFRRVQRKFTIGPLVRTLNDDLVLFAERIQPDMIFVYRGDLVYATTLKRIKTACPGTILVGYNNDDPFSPRYPFWYWRHFVRSISDYDLVLAYRQHNVEEFVKAGALEVRMMRSWFIPERHYMLNVKKKYDVVFVGHAEDDDRQNILESITEAGYELGLFGPAHYWCNRLKNSEKLKHLLPITPVWGNDYNRVLNEAKVALCFFSALNRDTYTRRCFEIPATGTVMLAQYSEDLATMFRPDEEAVFFRSKSEMLLKLKWLLDNDAIRQSIGRAGQKKVHDAGHDINSRMRHLLEWCTEVQQSKKHGSTTENRTAPQH